MAVTSAPVSILNETTFFLIRKSIVQEVAPLDVTAPRKNPSSSEESTSDVSTVDTDLEKQQALK